MYTLAQTSPRRRFFSLPVIPGGKTSSSGSHIVGPKAPSYMAGGYLKGFLLEKNEDILMIELFGKISRIENKEFIEKMRDNHRICEVKFVNSDIETIKVSKKAGIIKKRKFNKVQCEKEGKESSYGMKEAIILNVTMKIFEFVRPKEYEKMAARILETAEQEISPEQKQLKETIPKPEIEKPLERLSPRKASPKPNFYIYYLTPEQKKEKRDFVLCGKLARPIETRLEREGSPSHIIYYSFFKDLKEEGGEMHIKSLYIQHLLCKVRLNKKEGVKVIKVSPEYKELMDILQVSGIVFRQKGVQKDFPINQKIEIKVLKKTLQKDGPLLLYERLAEEVNK